MRNKVMIILMAICIMPFWVLGQCEFLSNGKSYASTCFQDLCKSETGSLCFASPLSVSIVKNGALGFFVISYSEEFNNFRGKVFVYLDDNTVITLLDKGKQWRVNGILYGQFNLTQLELKSLIRSNIRSVRFWICSKGLPSELCDGALEYYNVGEQDTYLGGIFNKGRDRIDFPGLINDLY